MIKFTTQELLHHSLLNWEYGNPSFGCRYSIVGSSPEERKMFRILRMQYVVLDEAHMLKNMATVRYDNLARINVSTNVTICRKYTACTVYFILLNAWPPQV